MKLFAAVALLASAQMSAHPSPAERVRLMKAIDTAVQLPPKAYPLHRYARFYAVRPDGKIAALFNANTKTRRPKDWACSTVGPDGKLTPIPCGPDTRPRADEQRWVEYKAMPLIEDGGCSAIDVIYNPLTATVEDVACHGVA